MSVDLVEVEASPTAHSPPEDASPSLTGFGLVLFGRVPPEDLAPYDADTLRRLADNAAAYLAASRAGGLPAIRLGDVDVAQDGVQRELTLLEAVNDDMPFLLDSTLAELVGRGYEPKLVAHPIVERAADGSVAGEPTAAATAGSSRERSSFIHIHLDRIAEADRAGILADLSRVYADVAAVAADSARMHQQFRGLAAEYQKSPPPADPAQVAEACAFLDWLDDGHFTLLGLRAYRIGEGGGDAQVLDGSGLGLLRDPAIEVLKRGRDLVGITPEIRAFLERPGVAMVTKASVRSRVHRRAYLDYVGVKLFSPSGPLFGELALVGLFTGAAYTSRAADTPYLRGKVAAISARAGFDPSSFVGRALAEVLETYPRDELFQIGEDELFDFATEMLRLSEHPRIRALARIDPFDRFVSCIVFVPKDRYDTAVRHKIGAFLARSYGGRVSAAYPDYPDGPLARTHYIIGRDGGPTPVVERETLERAISTIVRTWDDRLASALVDSKGGMRARLLSARYAGAFGAAYREAFDPAAAIVDLDELERLSDAKPRAVALYRREGDAPSRVNLKLFSRGVGLPLSERVPLLERLGFVVVNERTYRVAPLGEGDDRRVWLHDMALERATGAPVEIAAVGGRIEAALLAVFRGIAEADGFNKLVLEAGLGWRDAAMVRAYARYLRQIGTPYGQVYIADVLAQHGAIVSAIVDLFHARFDPRLSEEASRARQDEVRARVTDGLAAVTSLDDDRILRRFVNLVDATLRNNFFQTAANGLPAEVIAFKFECAAVEDLPKPKPLYEIFLNSARVEGLHLRFGKVARGGLRWTDRPQDFRTEVLGLVKAQQVKNAVIVPVGAKGGFFPKLLPPASDRAAWIQEGTEAYRIFIRTLLAITDNLDGDRVVPPPELVRRDGDDPYLVVAADKGTATFSDVANAISLEKGHWLGDAFASGGSNGYDHKAMGITARGAWESVKRHFREMDVDIQTTPITVAGVGDMSGDVFGNGMLLSRCLKLVAAFDHRDIFLDPDPDPELSFLERERLFALPRSSWGDYDRGLISEGGGVFSRGLKSVPLSPAIRAVLGLEVSEAPPSVVMSAILKAPVDLLWFGGIGTYSRAAAETEAAAGDRANDAVRITGAAVRARVIGEGANLGVTQRGRIEAALAGIRLNTDAIDNSAGVNTSDVEVNIKIALAGPERNGALSFAERNALLATMTDEVGGLVLRNNYLQSLALSLAERRGAGGLGFLARLMASLEAGGRLDRAIEYLPDDATIDARRAAGTGLTRPELSVLLAYAKLALHDELLASTVPDDPYLGRELERYFPTALRERFPDAIAGHRLRREIISTQLANAIVNRGGPAIVVRLADETGADAPTIAAAYAATRDAFRTSEVYEGIDALDGTVSGALQLDLYEAVQDLTVSRMVWFIRNVDFRTRRLDDVVGQYASGIQEVASALGGPLSAGATSAAPDRAATLEAAGVPSALARRLASLPDLMAAPDIVLVAGRTGQTISAVAETHFAVDGLFGLRDLSAKALAIPVVNHYDRLARDRGIDALAAAHRRLTAEVGAGGSEALAAWTTARKSEIDRIRRAVDGIVSSGLSVSKLTVAASLLSDLAKE